MRLPRYIVAVEDTNGKWVKEDDVKELEKDCEDYENTITEMTQKIAEMEDELAEALQENGVQHE